MCLSEPAPSSRRSERCPDGFTLIELMVVITIIGLIAGIAIPNYMAFIEKGKAAESAATMLEVQSNLEIYFAKNNAMPATLAELGGTPNKDEWGNDFVYLPLDGYPEHLSLARVSQHFAPLNTDYDLWSPGKDGLTNKVIEAEASQDDIIRAHNGSYFGLSKDY